MTVHQRKRVVEAPNFPADQAALDVRRTRVGGDPIYIRSGQAGRVSHKGVVAAEQSPHSATCTAVTNPNPPGGALNCLDDHGWNEDQAVLVVEASTVPAVQLIRVAQTTNVGGDPIYIRSDHPVVDDQSPDVAAEQSPHSVIDGPNPNGASSSGVLNSGDHPRGASQSRSVAAPYSPMPAKEIR